MMWAILYVRSNQDFSAKYLKVEIKRMTDKKRAIKRFINENYICGCVIAYIKRKKVKRQSFFKNEVLLVTESLDWEMYRHLDISFYKMEEITI